jgi:hypothetical protein
MYYIAVFGKNMRRAHTSRPGQQELGFLEEPRLPSHEGLRKVLHRVVNVGDLRGVTFEVQQRAADLLMDIPRLSEQQIHERVKGLGIHVSDAIIAKHAQIDFWEARRG